MKHQQNKEEQDSKKDIARRLYKSDKKLWQSLSAQEQGHIVDVYYNFSSVEKLGLGPVIQDNRNMRRDFGLLVMSLMLGVLGGVFSDILRDWMKGGLVVDLILVVAFFVFLGFFVWSMDKWSIESLGENNILTHLIKEIRKGDSNEK